MLISEARAEQFWAKIDKSAGEDACWPWTGHRCKRFGHGQVKIRTLSTSAQWAHRIAYLLHYGELNPDMVIRHYKCNNPPCCNPKHLKEGTHEENAQDRVRCRRSACGWRNGNWKGGRTAGK